MSRLGKKCFFASAIVHLVMLAVLVFGSAFLVPADKAPAFTPIKVYSLRTLTDAMSRGGSPNVKAAPAPPAAHPPVIKRRTPPVHRVETPSVVEPFPEPPKEKKPRVVLDDEDLKPVKHSAAQAKAPAAKPKSKPRVVEAQPQADPQEEADNRRRVEEFREIAKNIGSGVSASAPVEILPGPGTDGPAMANYAQVIFSKYHEAWKIPLGLEEERASVLVSVTIARDGQVISAHILEYSGNRALDRSIQTTIERVTFLEPFPEGSKDQQRTFKLRFNPQDRRA